MLSLDLSGLSSLPEFVALKSPVLLPGSQQLGGKSLAHIVISTFTVVDCSPGSAEFRRSCWIGEGSEGTEDTFKLPSSHNLPH